MSMKTRRFRPTLRRAAPVAGFVLLMATVACSTDVSGFGAIGTFTLTNIDEAPLPTTLEGGTEVLSGSIDLNSEAHCTTRTVVVRPLGAAQEEAATACTWSQNAGGLAIVWPDGSPSLGFVDEGTVAFEISATTSGCPPVTGASCAPSEWAYER